jgi:hypothetical protein
MTSIRDARVRASCWALMASAACFGCGAEAELADEPAGIQESGVTGGRVRKVHLPEEACCAGLGGDQHAGSSMVAVPRAALGLAGAGVVLGTSCQSTAKGGEIYFVDPGPSDLTVREVAGTLVHTLDTSFVPPNGWGAFAFRGDLNPPDILACANSASDSEPHDVYRINLASGETTFYFRPVDATGNAILPTPGKPYCDGLAWDSWNDTIFFSSDLSDTVYHLAAPNPDVPGSPAVFIKSLPVPSPGCFGGDGRSGNSGIEVVGNNLLLSCSGQKTIFEIDQQVGSVVRQFRSGTKRALDLACDAQTFQSSDVSVVWAKDGSSQTMTGFEAPPGSCGLCREDFRRDLNSLSETEQQQLAELLAEYLSVEVIADHVRNFGLWHGPASLFISAHRGYIGGFEIWLLNVKNRPEFVPMPKWNPANPIPPAFRAVLTDRCLAAGGTASTCRNIVNPTPNRPLPAAFQFTDATGESGLCAYPDYRTLHEGGGGLLGLERRYHDGVHSAVGGAMSFGQSPSALVFFPWHAFIDDISREWECRCRGLCQSCTDTFLPTFPPAPAPTLAAARASSSSPPIGFWWWFEDLVVPPDLTRADTKDRSGLGITGEVHGGAAFEAGKVGQALGLDGSDDFVEVADAAAGEVGDGDFTIETWVRATASGVLPIVEKLSPSGAGYSLFLNDGKPGLYLGTDTASREFTSPTLLPLDGEWHHLAASVRRGEVDGASLLIDGVAVARFDTTPLTGAASSGAAAFIGRSTRLGAPRFFAGAIDELTLLGSALSDNDVASIYRAGSAGKFGSMSSLPTPVEQPSCIEGLGLVVEALDEAHLSEQYGEVLSASAAGNSELVEASLGELAAHAEQHIEHHQHDFADPDSLLLHSIYYRAELCREQELEAAAP